MTHRASMPAAPVRVPAGAPSELRGPERGGVGTSPRRPDGTLKVTGEFAYGSDLWTDDMILADLAQRQWAQEQAQHRHLTFGQWVSQ